MLGPNFHSPAAPKTNRYTETPSPKKTVSAPRAGTAGKSQTFVMGSDIPGDWWHIFHSKEIDALIHAGMLNSPNLAAAKAALVEAQQNYNAQLGSTLLPNVSGNFSGTRQLFNSSGFGDVIPPSIFNVFNTTVNVSYTLDIFGGLRRQLEVYRAQVNYQQYELEAAYLTLSANIVTTAITIASLRGQIQATHELIKAYESTLSIVRKQFNLGGASEADVLTQQAALAQIRATLPPLEQSLIQNMHTISILVGKLPSDDHVPHFDLNKLHLPAVLPVSLPSLLVRQRPDIRASEALLHAASAQIGVAIANMFPQVTITGNLGWENDVLSTLINPNNRIWEGVATVAQPIFNGGALVAQKQSAIAAYQQAAAQYRQVVLQAFKNVADTLRALEHDAEALRAQKEAEVSARSSYYLTRQQYRLGGVSYINLLTTENTYQQARINRIQAQAARYTDTAALFQALGGGWWNRIPLDCNADLCKNLSQYTPAGVTNTRNCRREI